MSAIMQVGAAHAVLWELSLLRMVCCACCAVLWAPWDATCLQSCMWVLCLARWYRCSQSAVLLLNCLPPTPTLLQGRDLWTSTHFTTAAIGLVLLSMQGMLSLFFEVGGRVCGWLVGGCHFKSADTLVWAGCALRHPAEQSPAVPAGLQKGHMPLLSCPSVVCLLSPLCRTTRTPGVCTPTWAPAFSLSSSSTPAWACSWASPSELAAPR